jgi:hypothetical protein
MSISLEFPRKIEGHVEQVPMFLTPIREPDLKQMQVLARVFKMKGDVIDEGDLYSIRTQDAILHQFHASDSIRWDSGMKRSEHYKEVLKITDLKELQAIADRFLGANKLLDKRASFSHIIFGKAETSGPASDISKNVNTCAYVNYTYSLAGLPLLGPGAKIQVIIGFDGNVVGCYRFWREVKEGGLSKKVLSSPDIQKIFRENPAFAQIKSGKVVVEMARLGYMTLPPSDVQGALIPVIELRGFVSTPEIKRTGFIRSLVAIDYTEEELKRYNVFNKHFSGSCRIM